MPTTSTQIKLSDILFTIKVTPLSICPGKSANSFCPAGTPVSPRRPAPKSGATASRTPKFSKLAVSLENILTNRVSAAWSKNGHFVYCEISEPSGSSNRYLYEGATRTLYCDSKEHASIPMLLYAMHSTVGATFKNTADACEQMMLNVDVGATPPSVIDRQLGYLCDCFYYDWVDELAAYSGTIDVKPIDNFVLEQVKHAAKTNALESLSNATSEYIGRKFNVGFSLDEAKSSATASPVLTDEFFDDAKSGKYTIGYEWSKEQQDKIRPLSILDDFIPNETYRKMVMLANKRLNRVIDREFLGKTGIDAIKDDYVNIIIGGRPGTGKTTTADALAATLGLPCYTAKVTRNTEEDAFEGMTKANSEGKFVLHDTAFLKAFENGGVVVLEEFNLADPGVMQGAIGQAIEYPFILNKDGYQEVRRHPMCIIVATMNTGTQGAREPNQALTSRLPVTLTMNDPTEDEFIKILEKHGHKKTPCKKVYKAYTSILNYLKNVANDEEIALCVTMRHCLAALSLVDDGICTNLREAVYDTMVGAIGLRNAELAAEVFEKAVKPLPLN